MLQCCSAASSTQPKQLLVLAFSQKKQATQRSHQALEIDKFLTVLVTRSHKQKPARNMRQTPRATTCVYPEIQLGNLFGLSECGFISVPLPNIHVISSYKLYRMIVTVTETVFLYGVSFKED